MKAARLKTTEVQEAAQAFIASGFNADDMRPLMNLMSWQTSYIQKWFLMGLISQPIHIPKLIGEWIT